MQKKNTAVYLACDFLMTRQTTQSHHLRWFSTLLGSSLRMAVENPVEVFLSDQPQGFSREDFFAYSGINSNTEDVHLYFDPSDITEESVSYLHKYIDRNSIVIGYELSSSTREVLDRAEITYIDIWLHPIRFMDDNFYAYISNDPKINVHLSQYHLQDNVYELYANRLKIQSYMGWNKFKKALDEEIVPNSCLFVGQTLSDKAICHKGKMLTVLDFQQEFLNLTDQFDHVYFSRHPMLPPGADMEQIEYLEQFSNVSIIDVPGYELLCSEHIEKVVAISSSLVYEAAYFGKETSYFQAPVISIYKDGSPGYFSVFGKLHNPVFWSDILAGHCAIKNNVMPLDFMKADGNYRDMLALYYNNQVFDKNHASYLGRGKANDNQMRQKGKDGLSSSLYNINRISFDRINREIQIYDVVSFDIFDTLLQRNLSHAGDVLSLVADYTARAHHLDADSFLKERKLAKQYSRNEEETTLEERYAILGNRLGITEIVWRDLYQYELHIERSVLQRRTIGCSLLDQARLASKRIILTSDTYFQRDFIEEILKDRGIEYDALYLSSEHDKTKETGSLYKILLKEESGAILHIGDNHHSDYIKARARGMDAIYLPSNNAYLLNSINGYADLKGYMSPVRNGLIKNKMAEFPAIANNPGYSQGKSQVFGYAVVGDIFLAFASWIIERALEDKVHSLYFMARDGDIIKKAVDTLLSLPDAPAIQTHYFLASRRALRVCAMEEEQDVLREIGYFIADLQSNRYPADLSKHVSQRFGLEQKVVCALDGSSLLEERVNPTTIAALEQWLSSPDVMQVILDNAQHERALYLDYCQEMSLLDAGEKNVAFVDIGHHGSLQASLAKLLNKEKTIGYYFATYSAVDDVLRTVTGEHLAYSFHLDRFDLKSSVHEMPPYVRHALVVETLFLNNQGSFIKFTPDAGAVGRDPVYMSLEGEEARIQFIEELHEGVVAYCRDFVDLVVKARLPLDRAGLYKDHSNFKRLYGILANPEPRDAMIFAGVTLENFFSGRNIRYLVPSEDKIDDYRDGNIQVVWPQGTSAYIKHVVRRKKEQQQRSRKKRLNYIHKIERMLIGAVEGLTSKKLRKYDADRDRYFAESKKSMLRWYGKIGAQS